MIHCRRFLNRSIFLQNRRFITSLSHNAAAEKAAVDAYTNEEIDELIKKSQDITISPLCRIDSDLSNSSEFLLSMNDTNASTIPLYKSYYNFQLYIQLSVPILREWWISRNYSFLILERLKQYELMDYLGLDLGFNKQVLWTCLHFWIISNRILLTKKVHIIENFDNYVWRMVDRWIIAQGTPRYRLTTEAQHAKTTMMTFLTSLEKAFHRPDIFPARLHDVIWTYFFFADCERTHPKVMALTVYTIRQVAHVINVREDHFLSGKFLWADLPA